MIECYRDEFEMALLQALVFALDVVGIVQVVHVDGVDIGSMTHGQTTSAVERLGFTVFLSPWPQGYGAIAGQQPLVLLSNKR